MQTYKVEVYDNGDKYWYVNGKFHRLDGPAVELVSGYKSWYVNGKYHRLDGPAVERSNGDVEYWLNDVQYTEEEYNAKMNPEQTIEVNGHTYKLVK